MRGKIVKMENTHRKFSKLKKKSYVIINMHKNKCKYGKINV